MARIVYDPTTGLGQLIAEAADNILSGRDKLERVLNSMSEMDGAGSNAEIGMDAAEYTNNVNGLTAIVNALNVAAINALRQVDQG